MVVDDAFQVAPFLPAPPVSAFDIRRRRPGWPAATTPASPLCASAGIPPPSRSAAADRPVGQARTIFHKAGMAVCRAACTSRPRSPESKRPATSGAMPRLPQGWTTSGEQTRSTSQERLRRRRSAAVCEIAVIGTDQTMTMNEWRYGETPSGYRGRPCRPLGPGEYEVTVLAGPATGQARFRVVKGGGIEGLPWDAPAAVAEVDRLLRENDSNRRKTQKREADAVERSIAWPPQDSR